MLRRIDGEANPDAPAITRGEQLLHTTMQAVDPKLRLDYDPLLGNQVTQCLADIADADKMVTVDRTAWLRGVPSGGQVPLANAIKSYWEKQGYTIGDTVGFNQNLPQIDQVQTHDAFWMSLSTANNGTMSIGASSPCIYTDGTPPS
jgi:hypothetical protein